MFLKESVKIASDKCFLQKVRCFLKKALLKWFNTKIRRRFEKINLIQKLYFERSHSINWEKDKCVICKFPMKMEPTNYLTPDYKMTFGDFIIRYEHKFLRNIYTTEEIQKSGHIKNLQCYYEIFQEYIQICTGLLALLNSFDRHDYINSATEEFVENQFAGDDINDIKNTINQTEIKNILSMTKGNVSKFNLKVYAYVYDELFDFPPSDIDYEIITTNKFFLNVHRLIRDEYHLHHSHITGNINGYAHNFCNATYVEKSTGKIPFIAHNFFGFDLFYFLKTYTASAWCSKEFSIGGTNLTHANFGNISSEIKLIDSLKFYQLSLGEFSSTLTLQEKTAVKNLAEKFLNKHHYFSTIWPYLSINKKKKILEIIMEEKGVIPYEIIVDVEYFFIKLDKDFWEKTEFFSKLKLSAVNDEDYENSKYLYKTLQMRNVGDLNDLYNTQDVLLLTKIIESRFQAMHNTYGFHPRKCNSASSMSGCIEREMPKIILALPTKYEHVEMFEETVIGSYSCVNARLAFDTQILLPNLNNPILTNPMNKGFNYKVVYNLKFDKKKVKKRVITKILKLDENNQYGNGMTKPLPNVCIKDDNDTSWETFNFLLETFSFEDNIGDLYIVDIEFDYKNATEKEFPYNEIYPPIIEKQKTIDPCEGSVLQLLEQFFRSEKGPTAYRATAKAHSNLF